MWEITRRVMRERRKRELEPILKMLEDVKNVEITDSSEDDKGKLETKELLVQKNKEIEEFKDMMNQIDSFANRAEKALDVMIKASESKIVERFLK